MHASRSRSGSPITLTGLVMHTHPLTQADLDLGNYERFLDITLKKDNNLTTGKIYQVGAM